MIHLVFLVFFMTGATVVIHAVGVILMQRWLERTVVRESIGRFFHGTVVLVKLVTALVVVHLAEIALWSTAYRQLLGSWEEAVYFSATSYSTVGYGDVVLEPGWRMVGVTEAIIGVLMVGWSTGLLFTLAARFQGAIAQQMSRTSNPPQVTKASKRSR